MALHFMDLSQAEPFDGSAGSSRGFQKLLEASIVDIHTVQKVYSGATYYCTESVQWRHSTVQNMYSGAEGSRSF